MNEPAIVIEGLSKRFRLYRESNRSLRNALIGFQRARYTEFWALRDITLTVEPGEMFGVIGHNGSGKSTLLRAIAGIYGPTTGKVVTRGRVAALLELGAGFHPELSGRENVMLNGALLGIPKRKVQASMDDIVEMADIGEFIDSPVEIYSSGMRARLGFAVSVHMEPDILLADEIISVGDVRFAERCSARMQQLRSEGVTTVLVSHNLALIESTCSSAAWLDHGHLKLTGPAHEVVDAYRDFFTVGAEPGTELSRFAVGSAIEEVVVTNRAGAAIGLTGEPLDVQIAYDVGATPFDGLVRVRFHHEHGPICLGDTLSPAAPLVGQGVLEYQVPALPIGPGHYAVEVRFEGSDGTVLAAQRAQLPIEAHGAPGPELDIPANGAWESLVALETSASRR